MDNKPAFSKEELVRLATSGETIGVRTAAAEALYSLGRADGSERVSALINQTFAKPAQVLP